MPQIITVGLGPGAWEQVTLEAQEALKVASTVYLRTRTHPTADHLPPHLDVRTFDYLYEREADFSSIYRQIAEELVRLALESEPPIVYCVPGHPLVGEASVRHLREMCAEKGVQLKVVAGLSFLEPVCTALALDPLERGLQIVDGTELASYGQTTYTPSATQHSALSTQHSEEPFLFSPYPLPV